LGGLVGGENRVLTPEVGFSVEVWLFIDWCWWPRRLVLVAETNALLRSLPLALLALEEGDSALLLQLK
jgi:hypothetical protein